MAKTAAKTAKLEKVSSCTRLKGSRFRDIQDDNTKRDQFRRNPLETAKSLGDGVCALVILLCSKHRPGVVEGSGLSERGLAQSWLSESRLLEGSCPKRL